MSGLSIGGTWVLKGIRNRGVCQHLPRSEKGGIASRLDDSGRFSILLLCMAREREGGRSPTRSGTAGGEGTVFYRCLKVIGTPILKVYFRISGEGTGHVPASGPFILAANHVSYLDPLVLAATCPRPLHFVMLREFWEKPFLGWVCRQAGSFPVDPGGPAAGALRRAVRLLREGRALGIFPEGGRSADGRLQPAKGGAALLALKTGVPLLPAAIIGAERAMPRGVFFPRPFKVRVRYGPPLFVPGSFSSQRKKDFLADVTELAMGAIEDLAGG